MPQGEQPEPDRQNVLRSLQRMYALVKAGAGPVTTGTELTYLAGLYGYELKPAVGEKVNPADPRTVNN